MTFYVCPRCGHLTHERADCPRCGTSGEWAYAFTDLDAAIEFRQSVRDARRRIAA